MHRPWEYLMSFCQSSINQVLAKNYFPGDHCSSLYYDDNDMIQQWKTTNNNTQSVNRLTLQTSIVCVATSRPFNIYECGDKLFSYLDVKYADIKMVVSLQDLNVQTFRSILSWKLNVEMFLRLQIFVCSNLTSCCILSLITMFRCSGVWLQTFKCSNEK